MNLRSAMACGVLAPTIACNTRGAETPKQGAAEVARAPAPADSLVATAPGGVEVWFTLSREGKAADGTPCTDRTMEIRRGGTRIPVPLLYTGTAPELVNDSTIRARLSNQCAPGDAYLVDLRSGRPVRER
ncbi:MAG TPA: hypothetical protein VM094_08235 [Gemmatimonadales bacterium]|nr:hypothetical protein [Gemmatimonadales bacterium]